MKSGLAYNLNVRVIFVLFSRTFRLRIPSLCSHSRGHLYDGADEVLR